MSRLAPTGETVLAPAIGLLGQSLPALPRGTTRKTVTENVIETATTTENPAIATGGTTVTATASETATRTWPAPPTHH